MQVQVSLTIEIGASASIAEMEQLYASNKVLHFRRNPELKCIGQNLLTKFYTFLPLGAFPRITAR